PPFERDWTRMAVLPDARECYPSPRPEVPPMLPYAQILAFVQQLAPTWRKPQHVNFAHLIGALVERENLALSDLARALPPLTQPLHGRVKRLGRFLDNPHLDELAVFVRWL